MSKPPLDSRLPENPDKKEIPLRFETDNPLKNVVSPKEGSDKSLTLPACYELAKGFTDLINAVDQAGTADNEDLYPAKNLLSSKKLKIVEDKNKIVEVHVRKNSDDIHTCNITIEKEVKNVKNGDIVHMDIEFTANYSGLNPFYSMKVLISRLHDGKLTPPEEVASASFSESKVNQLQTDNGKILQEYAGKYIKILLEDIKKRKGAAKREINDTF